MAARIRHATVGTTDTTVVLDNDYQRVQVVLRSAGEVYVRAGIAATVGGDDCDVVCGGVGAYADIEASGDATQMHLIATAPGVLVTVKGI